MNGKDRITVYLLLLLYIVPVSILAHPVYEDEVVVANVVDVKPYYKKEDGCEERDSEKSCNQYRIRPYGYIITYEYEGERGKLFSERRPRTRTVTVYR